MTHSDSFTRFEIGQKLTRGAIKITPYGNTELKQRIEKFKQNFSLANISASRVETGELSQILINLKD
ncbi:MAG: hypothetical protein M3T96_00740 [Acidobacteriota bacterium]|nr:hypothetical protein [Acidobacteriota bacterium]